MRGAEFTDELLVRELRNAQRSDDAHALALALVKPDNKFLTIERLSNYLQSKYEPLRLEAVRTLAEQSSGERFALLLEVAQDESQSNEVRAEAIVGLAGDPSVNRGVLEQLAASNHRVLRQEAERMLRLSGLQPAPMENKPAADELDKWKQVLAPGGYATAGRRLFFSPVGARCSVCHKYGGRGGNIGPDLTNIGHNASRESIITSILHPSREIVPDYQPWILTTDVGKTYTGLRLPKPGDDGKEDYVDVTGTKFTLPSDAIIERRAAATSIMPDNLQATLSIDDLRDLITFLTYSTDTDQKAAAH